MSDVRESTGHAEPGARPSARRPWPRIAVAVVLGLALATLGYALGVRSPWTAHHPHVVTGTAQRVAANVPTGYVDTPDGDRISFRLDDVVWRAGGRTGSGTLPPCLREEGRKVEVRAGLLEVSRPFGSGSYVRVLSVTCPAS